MDNNLKRLKDQKEKFLKHKGFILQAYEENKLRAVKCGPNAMGCRVQTMDGSFLISPGDIENMPSSVKKAFEDVFDELLQEV